MKAVSTMTVRRSFLKRCYNESVPPMPKLASVYTFLHQRKRELLFPFLLSALPTILQISLYYKIRRQWESNPSIPPASPLRIKRLTQSANRADAASLQNLIVKPHHMLVTPVTPK